MILKITFKYLKNYPTFKNIITYISPSIISIRLLSLKRQEELYKEIAPYVDLPFRNITCPKPNEQETN